MTIGVCLGCRIATARVTFDGFDLCEGCAETAYQEALSAPDCDDGSIAFVAMSVARLIGSYDKRDHVVTVGLPGVTSETLAKFDIALTIHGLQAEPDHVEGFVEICDPYGMTAWAAELIERMEAREATEQERVVELLQ